MIFSFIMISVSFSQTYNDKPFMQDYAEKFELNLNDKNVQLLQTRSDRNKNINILSNNGILQPWEKSLVADLRYRPLTDLKINAVEVYKDQFIYLTDDAVFSYAWAGKFYVSHDMKDASHLAIGNNFTLFLGAENKLVLQQGGEKVWEKSITNFSPMQFICCNALRKYLQKSTAVKI